MLEAHYIDLLLQLKKEFGYSDDDVNLHLGLTKRMPEYSQAHLELGKAYQNIGEFQNAKDSFLMATQLDPNNIGAKSDLMLILDKLGETEQAKNIFLEIAQINIFNIAKPEVIAECISQLTCKMSDKLKLSIQSSNKEPKVKSIIASEYPQDPNLNPNYRPPSPSPSVRRVDPFADEPPLSLNEDASPPLDDPFPDDVPPPPDVPFPDDDAPPPPDSPCYKDGKKRLLKRVEDSMMQDGDRSPSS